MKTHPVRSRVLILVALALIGVSHVPFAAWAQSLSGSLGVAQVQGPMPSIGTPSGDAGAAPALPLPVQIVPVPPGQFRPQPPQRPQSAATSCNPGVIRPDTQTFTTVRQPAPATVSPGAVATAAAAGGPAADRLRAQRGIGQDPRQPAAADSRGAGRASESSEIELSRIEAAFTGEALQPLAGTQALATQPLRQYGYAVFASDVSTFAPVDDFPVGPDYVLGPGDDLTINVWGPVDSTIVRTVDRNGRIVLPKIGDLRVWGLTFTEADRIIREQLSRYFRGFQTSVTMGRLRTVRVHVVGEVCQPGVYTLSSLATLTNALFSAGGPTKLGSLRNVRLLRNSHTVGTIDLYDFLQRGDRSRDFRLESGDTVFVPTIGEIVAVAGEVKRPAIYELRGDVRLGDLVQMAGGVTSTSYLRRVQIVRAQPSAERVTVDVDFANYLLKKDATGNPVVNGGDLVLIHRADPRIYNMVKVEGAVKYPGSYELKPLMKLSQLLPAEKLLPEALVERVEIARRKPDLSLEIVPVNLRKAWAGDAAQDLALRPLDEVTVRTELREARVVTLAGQVVRPGRYTIAENEPLSSVLERAGGFTDRAYLKSAVFVRETLRKTEQERLDEFIRAQEQRLLASASSVVVGAEKEEIQSQQFALQAQRDALRQLAARVAVGRMVVRLDAAQKLRGTPDDIVLVDGDALTVPEPPASVLVVGAVRTSTSVLYQQGANVDYYINRVGGLAKEADKKEIHIVRADGSAVSSFTNLRDLEPGDTVVVPTKQEEKVRVLPTVRDVLQAIGSALISFAALAVLF